MIVHADEEKTSYPGPIMRVPQKLDFRSFSNPSIIQEILDRYVKCHGHIKTRLAQAFHIMDRAITERDEAFKFILYWIGLELAADGIGDKVAHALSTAYGDSKQFAYSELGLRSLANARGDYIHRGQRPDLSALAERLFQAMFLDIVRSELGLPLQRLAQQIKL